MTRLYLVRHGETVDNVNKIMQGQTQGRLTAKGEAQAREVMEKMRTEHIDAFVSSDLKRSIDTCAIIAEPHGKPVTTTPPLRERDWGGYTGRYIPDLKDEVWPDDIETINDLMARAARFLRYIRDKYPAQTVVAVGHGIINKAIQAVYHHKAMKDILRMENAEVRVLKL